MIKWNGGAEGKAIPRNALVRVKFRDGTESTGPAECWDWQPSGEDGDIIEYEIADPAGYRQQSNFDFLAFKDASFDSAPKPVPFREHQILKDNGGPLPSKVLTASQAGLMRGFGTGATRSSDAGKPDYEGYLSPLVIERFGQYMTDHRTTADGGTRDSDNWQRGIPKDAYIKSGFRHLVDWWKHHRGHFIEYGIEETLCAILFNVSGYLHEHLKASCAAGAAAVREDLKAKA